MRDRMIMKPEALRYLVENNPVGTEVVYARGLYHLEEPDAKDTATVARGLAEHGYVALFQRRHDVNDFDYVAQKIGPAAFAALNRRDTGRHVQTAWAP